MYIPATDNVVKDYEIANSLRCNDDDSAYLSRTPASAGNRKTWTWAGWVKRGNVDATMGLIGSDVATAISLGIHTDGKGFITLSGVGNGWTTAVLRDPAAWYHIVIAFDTTQASAADRVKFYVNGTQHSLSSTLVSQNTDYNINNNVLNKIGVTGVTGGTTYLDGYLADVHFIDGQALDPSNFGETGTYGEWKPIQYTGTYGTNGSYLDFEASGDLGNDVSGNGNDWTPTNLAATDQMLDTPTNNFCTLNPLKIYSNTPTFQEGNLEISQSATVSCKAVGGMAVDSGKWYYEFVPTAIPVSTAIFFGCNSEANVLNNDFTAGHHGTYRTNGVIYNLAGTTQTSGGSMAAGDVIGVAVDIDNGEVQFYKNNVAQGATPSFTFTAGTRIFPNTQIDNQPGNKAFVTNFGADSSFAGQKTAQGNTDDNGLGDFFYSPPSGYLALCTSNLDEPTVVPSEHFSPVLWTGNATDDRSISGVGFQPDWVWAKKRGGDASLENHWMADAVRGVTKHLSSNLTDSEYTFTNVIQAFESDGFQIGTDGKVNRNNDTYVAWNWKANGTGVSNTDGSITSTVSANVDAGFSIVSYTGTGANATVGHGLSIAPDMVICKNRDGADHWAIYHSANTSAPETDVIYLNLTNATNDVATYWNDTAPTASVFSIGTNSDVNTSGENYISYAFHSVDGFSKFGSYTGNGSTDGPFVYCGFRPAYVMAKRTNLTGYWAIYDDGRDVYNAMDSQLYADSSSAEYSGSDSHIDMLSNGFKLRNTFLDLNGSGSDYIFMAFAENPFKHTNAR